MIGVTIVMLVLLYTVTVFSLPRASAVPTTYYVTKSGSDQANGLTWEDSFATIQNAITIASPGDEIVIGNGTFVESVIVDKANLTIRSENGAVYTTIQTANPNDHVFKVEADNVTISSLTIQGAYGEWKAGVYLMMANNCTIMNNIIQGNYVGIDLYGSGNAIGGFNVLFNNFYGVYLFSSSGNTIENNLAVYSVGAGFYLYTSSNNAIRHNISENHDRAFVLEYFSNNNTLEQNYAENSYYGIHISYSDGSTLEYNRVYNNQIGIRLSDSDSTAMAYNDIRNNENGIYLTGTSANNTATLDNIAGNTNYGVYNSTGNSFQAGQNWWGDPTGPSGEGPGTGDAVSVNVTYGAWAETPIILFSSNTGDANRDNIVNIVDALQIARYDAGLNPDPFDEIAADADCDGDVDIIDALTIARYDAGLLPGFLC